MLAATCGCDVAFGLDGIDARPVDAALPDGPVDAHVVGEATLVDPPVIGGPVVIDEVWPVRTIVHGTAGQYVPFAFTATGGTFGALPDEVLIGAGGTTEVVGSFTAPAARQQVTLTATATPRSGSTSISVLGLTPYGPAISGPGATTFQANTMFGIRLAISAGGPLRQLGLVSRTSCMAKLALYVDGSPATKVAEIGPVLLSGSASAPVTNTFALAPAEQVLLGTTLAYWLVAVADAPLTIPQQMAAGVAYTNMAFNYATPLPAQLSLSAMSGQEYAMFAVVAN